MGAGMGGAGRVARNRKSFAGGVKRQAMTHIKKLGKMKGQNRLTSGFGVYRDESFRLHTTRGQGPRLINRSAAVLASSRCGGVPLCVPRVPSFFSSAPRDHGVGLAMPRRMQT